MARRRRSAPDGWRTPGGARPGSSPRRATPRGAATRASAGRSRGGLITGCNAARCGRPFACSMRAPRARACRLRQSRRFPPGGHAGWCASTGVLHARTRPRRGSRSRHLALSSGDVPGGVGPGPLRIAAGRLPGQRRAVRLHGLLRRRRRRHRRLGRWAAGRHQGHLRPAHQRGGAGDVDGGRRGRLQRLERPEQSPDRERRGRRRVRRLGGSPQPDDRRSLRAAAQRVGLATVERLRRPRHRRVG